MAYLPSQPQSIGQVLDNAFRLFRGSFRHVLLLSLVYALLTQAPQFVTSASPTKNPANLGAGLGIALIVAYLIMIVGGTVTYMALLHAIHKVAEGQPARIGESLRLGFSKFFPMVGLFILVALAIMGGMLLLIIPGIILIVSLLFSSVCLVVENEGVIDSIKRSHRLVWGDWWRTATELTIIGIIYYLPLLGVGAVAGGVAFALGFTPQTVVFNLAIQLAATIAMGLMAPLLTGGYLTIFYDLDLRKGGGDLEARLSAAG